MISVHKLSLCGGLVIGLLLMGCETEEIKERATVATSVEIFQTAIQTDPLITEAQVSSEPNETGECKRIAFAVQTDAGSDIYSVCPDGSQLTNLTNDLSQDFDPAWSPDGTRLAFASTRSGKSQIYLMTAEGSEVTQLTTEDENNLPVWLPDGKRLAFRTSDGGGLYWWTILDLESLQTTQFSETSYDFFFQTPAWSPDVKRIAYMSLTEQQERNDGASQIHVKNVDGTGDAALTSDTWANIKPAWSPDGTRIAFLSERDGTYNSFALYVMNEDGTEVRRLTAPIYSETANFSWSPDGNQIAVSDLFPTGGILVIEVETGTARDLLEGDGGELSPAWQP